ncbi:prolyl-tRNA synthetase associated domain-containing protein [Promethearchaeum syntrophicum]|uniref:Prolyl-tRNA synthetase associated domain-containing protein n=1 Tax=Promethearchaeum syntrophicum TaxID=2594042 RepID=A0A5B9DDI3_9ARCH|nr:prolyl-tRNA synthetase associated domain-containing protein [Candidatus Prometheoarchaeum syntrophicum]QEE17055.1 YbaK / prolyl-tRNA synthetases associated domain protein [Candidatus Prometheoarchaeum syntrophicum]
MDKELDSWLENHRIKYVLHKHPAVFTVPEAKIHCGHIPGTHCKNLFLKDKKKGIFYLVTIPHNKILDLKQFRKMMGAYKIRFAGSEDLMDILGLEPGSVSPLGLINDKKKETIFIVDEEVWVSNIICCHPNINTETLQILNKAFQKLILETKNLYEVKKLPFMENPK